MSALSVRLRLRALVAMSRPPVLLLLGLFALLGQTQAGGAEDAWLFGRVMLVVVGFLAFSVVVNDLADEAVDRVNLPGDAGRPLVTGAGSRRQLPIVAGVSLVTALGAAATVSGLAVSVVVGGVLLSAAYSLPPFRLSARGAVASLVLPAGYVAVPFLVGVFGMRSFVVADDMVLLAGLYVGFIGRILLKDFRDVRGDAQFGKRTFLVRHGRRATCAAAGAAWVLGLLALAGVRDLSWPLVLVQAAFVGAAAWLLRLLSRSTSARRDEWLISAVAVVGRGMILVLISHLGMTGRGLPFWAVAGMTAGLAFVTLGQARAMAVRGPVSRAGVPAAWSANEKTLEGIGTQ